MKYVCPHCHDVVTCKWWESKAKLQCKNCHKLVFESVKQKLSYVTFASALLGILSIVYIMEMLRVFIWIKIPLLIVVLAILALLVSTIESIICKDLSAGEK